MINLDAVAQVMSRKQRERRSFVTRDRKIRYWRPALAAAFETLLAVDKLVFGGDVTPERPGIEFGDSVSDDPKQVAETLNLLDHAGPSPPR